MPEQTTLLDDLIYAYVSPPDDPAEREQALTTLRTWMWAVQTKDLDLMERIMTSDILIELPFGESGRSEPGTYRAFRGTAECLEFWRGAFAMEKEIRPFMDMELTLSADGSRLFLEKRGHLIMASGKHYKNRYVMRFDFEGGRIKHVREYYNPITSAFAFDRPIANLSE